MNGVRSIFRRKGYLLTALAAAVLLAASSGTAWAQVSIGFVESSGMISDDAAVDLDSLVEPQMIRLRVNGITSTFNVGTALGDVTITPNAGEVFMAEVDANGQLAAAAIAVTTLSPFMVTETRFGTQNNEVVLLVAQTAEGTGDPNWLDETVQLKLNSTGSAELGANVFRLSIDDEDLAPIAKFAQPQFHADGRQSAGSDAECR